MVKQRRNTKYTYNGEKHTVSEWSKITGINKACLWQRLRRYRNHELTLGQALGFENYIDSRIKLSKEESIEDILERNKETLYDVGELKLTLKECSELYNIPSKLLSDRIRFGWTIEQALTLPLEWGGGKLYTYNNKTMTLKAWSEELNVNTRTLECRLCDGFEYDRVFTSQSYPHAPRPDSYLTYNGITKTYKEWGKEIGVKDKAIKRRLSSGWTVGQALGFEKHVSNNIKNLYDFNGEKLSIREISERTGIKPITLRARIKSGKLGSRMFTTPLVSHEERLALRTPKKPYTYKGVSYTRQELIELAESMGMNKNTLFYRIYHNWSVDRALDTPIQYRKGHPHA